MKRITSFTVGALMMSSLMAQPTGWQVDDATHVAFRYDDHEGSPWEQESSHWQPGTISFWSDTTYMTGSHMFSHQHRIFSYDQDCNLDIESLVFKNRNAGPLVDRVRLDYEGLSLINSASWAAVDARIMGNGGQIDLFTGFNGNRTVWLGSTTMNSGRGNLRLYGLAGGFRVYQAVAEDDFGYAYYYGPNGNYNIYLGASSTNDNAGRIRFYDQFGNAQAGIYINSSGDGVVWGDTKSFRVPDPENPDREIWYASIEGPEAAVYERGTGQLIDGEVFISFSEHFGIVANPENMTVTLTPHAWDTYGLAVIEKTKEGFRVKELKAAKGNFAFDWEVKCVRKGKEDFQVFRSRDYLFEEERQPEDEPSRFTDQVKPEPEDRKRDAQLQHDPNCILSKPSKS